LQLEDYRVWQHIIKWHGLPEAAYVHTTALEKRLYYCFRSASGLQISESFVWAFGAAVRRNDHPTEFAKRPTRCLGCFLRDTTCICDVTGLQNFAIYVILHPMQIQRKCHLRGLFCLTYHANDKTVLVGTEKPSVFFKILFLCFQFYFLLNTFFFEMTTNFN